MAYVYRHIRLDKNEPFYIGIGVRNRANEKARRNVFWENVVAKTEYEVEILIDGLTLSEATEKEKEFIALYGRRNISTGTLTNLTDGGEGMRGYVPSEITRKKISDAKRGINPRPVGWKMTEEGKRKMSIANKGHKRCVGRILSDETKERIRNSVKSQKYKGSNPKPVVHLAKDGKLISEYISVKEAARQTNNFPQSIMGSIKRPTHHGNYWKFKSDYEKENSQTP